MNYNYKYSLERINRVLFSVMTGEQESKKRLIIALSATLLTDGDFPEPLQEEWKCIKDVILSKPKSEYHNAVYNSLNNRKNKTCSKVISDLYHLKNNLVIYIKNQSN